jgi:excinuclease UvrABC nuclease subunit
VGESREEYETKNYLTFLKQRMETAARALEFDKAARYRDEIRRIEERKGIQESVLKVRKAKKK